MNYSTGWKFRYESIKVPIPENADSCFSSVTRNARSNNWEI